MKMSINRVLLGLACACFLLEAVGINVRVNLIALGLFFWALSQGIA